jgi:CBS domain-containing protein
MRFRTTVGDVMTRNPICARGDATVSAVARTMREWNCGSIPICEEGQLVGVITDRDVALRVVAAGLDPTHTLARTIMSAQPLSVMADDPLRRAAQLMEREHLRRLPVVDRDGAIVGVISQVDIAVRSSQKKAGKMLASIRHDPLRH